MKLLTIAVIAAVGVSAAVQPSPVAGPRAAAGPRTPIPAESWAPRDTADSLWRRGRIAISEEAWERAANAFRAIVDRYPKSAYAGDALYWEAFALQRTGGQGELKRAVAALEQQRSDYPKAATYASGESSALLARLNGRLARGGDAEAAVAVSEMAQAIAEATVAGVQTAMSAAAAEMARVGPEVTRAMSEASREMAQSTARAARSARAGGDDDIPQGCENVVDDERIAALNALLQMDSDMALPILRKVLDRRDKCSELLRRKAVFLVSQNKSEEALDILVNTAKTDPDRPTREDAVFWLSQTGSPRAVDVLEQILLKESPDEEMQKKALFAISQSKSDRAQRILRDFAKRRDASVDVRGEAIFWLGQRKGEENATFLRELYGSLESTELKEKVIFSISQSRSPENARFLMQQAKDRSLDPEMRKTALFWAGQSGVSVKDLAEVYDSASDDVEVRKQVIFVLSQRKNDDAAVDKLLDIARKEPDRELRRQAIFWLGQSRDPRVVKLLEEIINK
jgi:HEAT repeat protein